MVSPTGPASCLYSQGVDLTCTSCSCKRLQLPLRMPSFSPTASYIKGKEDPKSFFTGASRDGHQIPLLSRSNSAKVNFHANIRRSDANKSLQRVCHIKTLDWPKNINVIMQNSEKNSDGWQNKRRMSKENRVYFILQSTDHKDLIWGMWQHVRIEERSKLHRKKSVRLNIVMKKLPCTEKYSVLFLYLWGIKYGSSHLSTPFFPDISSLSRNLSTRILFFFPKY